MWIASLVAMALGGWSVLAFAAPVAGGLHRGGHAVQGYLGVDLRDPSTKELAEQHPAVEHGTEIVRLDHDGPAGKAGLREHDLILQLNGQAIGGQAQLRHMLRSTAPGQQVSLLIQRDGQQMTVTAMMADRDEVGRRAWEQHIAVPAPDAPAGAGASAESFAESPPMTEPPLRQRHSLLGSVLGAPYTGLSVEAVTPQLGEFFGVQSGAGLLVRSVDANSPGMEAGLRAGDVVIKVNGTTIATEGEWAKQMHEGKGRPVEVLVLRDRQERTLTLTPDAKRKASLAVPTGPQNAADGWALDEAV